MKLNRNQKQIVCDKCGLPAVSEVVPNGFDDAPEIFTIGITCSGSCQKQYFPLTATKMHELTGLPLTGWPNLGQTKWD